MLLLRVGSDNREDCWLNSRIFLSHGIKGIEQNGLMLHWKRPEDLISQASRASLNKVYERHIELVDVNEVPFIS